MRTRTLLNLLLGLWVLYVLHLTFTWRSDVGGDEGDVTIDDHPQIHVAKEVNVEDLSDESPYNPPEPVVTLYNPPEPVVETSAMGAVPMDLTYDEYTKDSKCMRKFNTHTYCLGRTKNQRPLGDPCEAKVQAQSVSSYQPLPDSGRTGVALIACKRYDMFHKVITSLEQQSSKNFDLFVYIDKNSHNENEQIRQYMKTKLPNATLYHPVTNEGIAKLTLQAQTDIFGVKNEQEQFVYDRIILIEEDHLIGHTYVEALEMMMVVSDSMPKVGVVNGNYINTPADGMDVHMATRKKFTMVRDDHCSFQLTDFINNIDLNTHNVWAWGMTRKKYTRYINSYKKLFHESKLDTLSYRKRDSKALKKAMHSACSDSGYFRWAGQDWLRACALWANGMHLKLQPTNRLMAYIGSGGMHETASSYKQKGYAPVSAKDLSLSLEDYPSRLCNQTCLMKQFGG